MKIRTIVSRARAALPFTDKAGDDALLLLGSGRSGTTWLSELVLQKGYAFSHVTREGKINSSGEAWRDLRQADIDFAKTCLNRAYLMPYVHVGVWNDE